MFTESRPLKPIEESICVDASCRPNPGVMEYRVYNYKTKEFIFESFKFELGTNVIGEFLAIVHALAWMKKNNIDWVVYSDCNAAITWVKNKRINTGLESGSKTQKTLDYIVRAVNWITHNHFDSSKVLKWDTELWGEIPADYGRKK